MCQFKMSDSDWERLDQLLGIQETRELVGKEYMKFMELTAKAEGDSENEN